MSHSLFIHSSVDGHIGYFRILAIGNNAAMNIGVLMFFQIRVLGSFRYIPRSGITGSKGRSIFNFLKYLHITFYSGCTSVHSHQWWVPLSSHPHQYLLVVDLSTVVLICTSQMVSDIEHLSMCLLAICMLFLEKCLFRSFGYFFIDIIFIDKIQNVS